MANTTKHRCKRLRTAAWRQMGHAHVMAASLRLPLWPGRPTEDPVDACTHTILAQRTEKQKPYVPEMMPTQRIGRVGHGSRIPRIICELISAPFQLRQEKAEDVMAKTPNAANRQCGPAEAENQK